MDLKQGEVGSLGSIMSQPLYLDPEYSGDPYLNPFIEAAGEDRHLELDEMCGMSFVGLDDHVFTLDTEFLCSRARNQLGRYQNLLLTYTNLQGKDLWEFSLRITDTEFDKDKIQTDSDLYVSKPKLVGYSSDEGAKEIHVEWLRESDGSVYATLVLVDDPQNSFLTLQDSTQNIPLTELTLIQAIMVRQTAVTYNSLFYLECYDETIYPFRKILYYNNDFISRGINEGCFIDDTTPANHESQDQSSAFEQFVTTFFGSLNALTQTRERFSQKQPFLWQGMPFTLYGEDVSLQPQMTEQLIGILDSFPEEFRDYYHFSKHQGNQADFDFCVVTREEMIHFTGTSTVAAMHHSASKIIFIRQDIFDGNLVDPMEYSNLFHELCHATFDHMSSDSYAMRWGTPILVSTLGFIRDVSEIFPKDQQNAAFLSGSILSVAAIGALIGLAVYTAPKIAIPVLVLVAGIFILDWYVNAPVDRRGIVVQEMEKALEQVEQGASPDDVAVSYYALEGKLPKEFAAESLLAYFFTEDYTSQSGYYSCSINHGLKTQEELIAKNPGLFLAYDVFFSDQSPQQYEIDVFKNKEKAALIDEALLQAQKEDGTIDIQRARDTLFAGLSRLEEIERREALERP